MKQNWIENLFKKKTHITTDVLKSYIVKRLSSTSSARNLDIHMQNKLDIYPSTYTRFHLNESRR